MAFNTNLPTTDGTDFASDALATPGTHWPYCKLVFGADGTATIVSTSNALPVVQTGALPAGDNNIGNVDIVTMPAVSISGAVDTELPAAAALTDNFANPTCPAVGAFAMAWDGVAWDRVTKGQGNMAASLSVTMASDQPAIQIQGDQDHDAVAGTRTVLIGGFGSTATPAAVSADGDLTRIWVDRNGRVNITGSVSISGTVDTELPAAAALSDTFANPTAPAVGAFNMAWDSGGSQWVRVQTDGLGSIRVSQQGAVDTELPSANALADNMANPTAPAVASHLMGFDGTNWDRIRGDGGALFIQDGGNIISVDSAQLPAALVGGRLDSNIGAWLGSTAPTVAQKTMANSIPVVLASDQSVVEVGGDVAHDVAAAGNPLLAGLRANTSEPATAVADGDATYAWGDKWGRQVVTLDHPPKLAGANDGPYSENSVASGDVELIAAPGASTSIVVTGFWISNQGTAKNRVALREGAAGTIRYRGTLAADGGGVVRDNIKWVLPANTALTINIGAAGDIDANVDFFTQATP